ncbi:hypothetical protein NDU88_002680 [Pleurodeles waltl]|uniref:Uncharacterized protein n=1 Tax=Pleurodeles waltl TaxID=8319 RepID=A0AAV7VD99_PLEWA|nr:hypothetical protein NDU88_002680 [Pleurodeles waltl]
MHPSLPQCGSPLFSLGLAFPGIIRIFRSSRRRGLRREPPHLFSLISERAGVSTTTLQVAPDNRPVRAGAALAPVRDPSPASRILCGVVAASRPDLRAQSAQLRHQSASRGRRGPPLAQPVPVSSSSRLSAQGALNPPVSPLGVLFHGAWRGALRARARHVCWLGHAPRLTPLMEDSLTLQPGKADGIAKRVLRLPSRIKKRKG